MASADPAAPAPAPAEKPVSRRLQRMLSLEKLLSPEVGLERVDTYARWVFGGTAAVAALTALYTKQIVGDLNPWGRLAAALGLVLLALAMGAAAHAMAPVMVSYTPGSIDSMERALDTQFARRRPWVEWAGRLLALALAVYGMAPLVGAATGALPGGGGRAPRPVNQTAFSYAITQGRGVTASLSVAGAAPFSTVAVTLDRVESASAVTLVAQTAAITDAAGRATAKVAADSLPPGTYALHARYVPVRPGRDGDAARPDTVERREIRIPPPRDVSPPGPTTAPGPG